MNSSFFPDSWSEAFAKVIAASLPFISMGFLDKNEHPALIIAAGSVGFVALIAFFIRVAVLFKNPPKRVPELDKIMSGLTFPYLFAVAFGIGIRYGEPSGWYGVWFSLFLAAWVIVAVCVSSKKRS